ncbi:MAG: cytidine deaminase [Prevotellaceae bacterium]|jgi:cytidine deaminase|nr:cytidine deaminase [Prevotellaceae bacterium]
MDTKYLTIPVHIYQPEELSAAYLQLVETAKEVSGSAYTPYSHFNVGAAVLLTNGEVICGNNQENAAYPSGLCAERVAMFYANARYPDQIPKVIAIAAQNANGFLAQPVSPCGSCRQSLLETENRYGVAIELLLYGTEGIYHIKAVHDLLPLAFGSADLVR